MSKQDEQHNMESWDPDFYETGSTRPPKSYGGVAAVLLVAVILLGGLCSALGIINMKLLQQLADLQEPKETVTIFDDMNSSPTGGTTAVQDVYECRGIPCLDLEGQTVSDFDQRFYNMPPGVLILKVTEGGSAHEAGMATGDVITGVDGQAITGSEELTRALEGHEPGQTVMLTVYRPKSKEALELKLELSEE